MSLLYEALLKNNQNKSANGTHVDSSSLNSSALSSSAIKNTEHSAFLTNSSNINTAQINQFSGNKFAREKSSFQQSGKHIPPMVWIFIGSLLLMIGLLAGYIYGNALLFENNLLSNKVLESKVVNNKVLENTATESEKMIKIEKASEMNEKFVSTEVSRDVSTELSTKSAVTQNHLDNNDKSVEIALDLKGQMISKVSTLTGSKPDEQVNKEPSVEQQIPDTSKAQEKRKAEQALTNKDNNEQVSLDDIPDKLKASFADAIKATEASQSLDDSFEVNLSEPSGLLMLDDLTSEQAKSLPNLIYQMHIYSSDISERWIRVNGKTLYEGNELQQELTLLEIKQDSIIWRFNNIKVGQVALVDFIK